MIKHQSGLISPADPGEISQGIAADDRSYQDLNPSSVSMPHLTHSISVALSVPLSDAVLGSHCDLPLFSLSNRPSPQGARNKDGGAAVEPG